MSDTTDNQKIKPEWSHTVEAEDVSDKPLLKKISASPQERKDLARRTSCLSVDKLEAQITVMRADSNFLIHASGPYQAELTQECVVTGEPVQKTVKGQVEGWFAEESKAISLNKARHEKMSQTTDSEVPILGDKDDPESVIDGVFDIGELVVQYLLVDMDLYPRKENADHPDVIKEEEIEKAETRINNPFAALKNWKNRQENGK